MAREKSIDTTGRKEIMKQKKVIFIIGDSTAAEKLPEKRPESGWGEYLSECLGEKFTVQNYAVNGRSTKSFLEEGLFEAVDKAMQSGDYLIIQFGHNDQKKEDPLRYTEPFGEYQKNIAFYVDEARKKGVFPIVLSSISRRDFESGVLNPQTLEDYPKAALEIAEQLHVAAVDIFSKTQKYLTEIGEEQSQKLFLHLNAGEHENYPEGSNDNTHLNVTGARLVARLIAEELIHIL